MRGQRSLALSHLGPPPGALTELAVARGAFVHVDLFALFHRPAAGRGALPVGTSVNIPAGDLVGSGRMTDVVIVRGILSGLSHHRARKGEWKRNNERESSQPRHSRAPRR